MEKKELTLREMQIEETIMLKKIVDFCDAHNLKYYICGGTLLGAIRHKGFIPWDDDIDIMMPRREVERLEQIIKGRGDYLEKNIKFASCRLGNSNCTIIRVYNTEIEVDSNAKAKEEKYLWLDIFPIDGLPESKIKRNIKFFKATLLKKLSRIVENDSGHQEKTIKNLLKESVKNIIRYIFKNRESNLSKQLEKNAKRYDYDTSKYVGVITWGNGPEETMLHSEMEDFEVEFEGLKFNTMACYEKYLTNLYGDYMKLPPENKRKTHISKIVKIIE